MLSPGKVTDERFSPNQKKQIATMMSSQMKRVFKSAVDSKGKRQKMEEYGDDDDNLATIIASCMIESMARFIICNPRNRFHVTKVLLFCRIDVARVSFATAFVIFRYTGS